jgi:hypothetical protein
VGRLRGVGDTPIPTPDQGDLGQRKDRLHPVATGVAGGVVVEELVAGHIRAQIFLPEDPEPLLIDRATVKWVKSSEFGVDFDTPQPKVAERITTVITTLVETQQGSFRKG